MTAPAPAAGTPGTKMTHREVLIVFSGLMAGMLLAALDQTIVATALPTIVGDLGGLEHLAWVVTAYLLTSTAATPLFGKISDMYGRKLIFQAAIVIFLIGSVLSGLSQNMAQLIGFRAIQGMGGGGLMALSQAIIGDIVSPRERGRYMGYIGSVFALASIAGPLLGGWFVDNLTWQWVFYINLPVGAVALWVTSATLKLPVHRVQRKIDYLGAALMVTGVTSLLLATVWGGEQYPWGSPQIIGLLVAGTVLSVLFVLQEARAEEPILPLRLFRSKVFTLASAGAVIVGAGMFGAIVFLPVFLQVVTGASATNSGLLLLPLMAGLILTSTLSGRLITRTGRYRVFPIFGTAMMAVGLFLLSTMDATTTRLVSSVYMVVLGVGIGSVMQVLVLAVQNDVDQRDLGVATSAASFFRSLGGSVGSALFGAVLSARLAYWLPELLPAGAAAELDPSTLQGSPEVIAALPADVHAAVVEAYANSTETVFLLAIPLAILGFLLMWFLPERPLRETVHVAGVGSPEDPGLPFEPGVAPGQLVDEDGRRIGPPLPSE